MVTIKSRPIPLNQYTDVFDEESIGKAISFRKAKWDDGVNKVQNTINQLGQLPTITTEDSNYVTNKVKGLTDTINNIAGLDLSNSMNVSQLANMGNEIINDPIVLNAISSAKNNQKNQTFIEEAKTNPKKYGDVIRVQNEDDYYTQLQNYKEKRARGENAIFNYSYQAYKDVEGILSKEMEKVKASSTSTKDGNYFLDKEELTPAKLKEIATNRIMSDPSLQNQLRINANYSTKNVSDLTLLETKNKAQLLEINNRRANAYNYLIHLNSLDKTNPEKNESILEKAKKSVKDYEDVYKQLLSNPHKVLLGDNTLTDKYDRNQLAYELITLGTIDSLVSKHSYSKTKLRANPIPLQEANLNFDIKQSNFDNTLAKAKFDNDKEQQKITNILEQFKSSNSSGKKFKIENGQVISLDSPSVSYDDNPKASIENELKVAKNEGKAFLRDIVKQKINDLGDMISPHFLDKYVDLMIKEDGTMVNLDENKSVARLKQQFIQAGNKNIPEDIALRHTIRWINQLSKDANNIWTGDGVISKGNAIILAGMQNHVQKVHTLTALPKVALTEALSKAGVTEKEYADLLIKEKKLVPFTRNNYNPMLGVGSITTSRNELNLEDQSKLAKIREFEKKYYEDKTQITKLYAIQNFDTKDDGFYSIERDMTGYIKGKGLSYSSLSLDGTAYGKEQKWDKVEGTFKRLIPKSYSPKKQQLQADVIYTNSDGSEVTYPLETFYVPKQYVDKYLSEETKKGSRDLNYTDQLHLSPNGKITLLGRDGKYKESLRTTPTVYPVKWKATLQNPNDKESDKVDVWINIPINGKFQTFKFNEASNAEMAEEQLTTHIESVIAQLLPLVKANTITEEQLKEKLLQSLKPR